VSRVRLPIFVSFPGLRRGVVPVFPFPGLGPVSPNYPCTANVFVPALFSPALIQNRIPLQLGNLDFFFQPLKNKLAHHSSSFCHSGPPGKSFAIAFPFFLPVDLPFSSLSPSSPNIFSIRALCDLGFARPPFSRPWLCVLVPFCSPVVFFAFPNEGIRFPESSGSFFSVERMIAVAFSLLSLEARNGARQDCWLFWSVRLPCSPPYRS